MNEKINTIENNLLNNYLEPKERILLRYYFKLNNDFDSIKKILQNVNPEDNRNFLMLVAQTCFENNCWELVNENYRNKIKGIYRYNQLSNALMLNVLDKVVKAFNKENIIPILIKGDAMRLYFDINKARLMSDVDLVVKPEEYDKAKRILIKMGASIKGCAVHSETFAFNNIDIDLHSMIFKFYEEKDSNIFKRLNKININNNFVYVLSNLDMFIHILHTQTYCFILNQYSRRRIKWLYDAYIIWQKLSDEDVAMLSKHLKELHCLNSFYFTYELFIDCFKEIKEKIIEIKPDLNYKKWFKSNLNISNIYNNFNSERQRYDLNTYSLKIILLHFKYLIDYRNYQLYYINSEGRIKIKHLMKTYGLYDFDSFNRIVLNSFRIKSGKNNE